MVGREGKLVVPPPDGNCTSVDKDLTLQSCKITQRLCKAQSLFGIITWGEYVGNTLLSLVYSEPFMIFSCNSLTSCSQFMNAREGSAAGLLDVIGMIV